MSGGFVTGPDIRPARLAGQRAIELLESASAAELASSVPYLKIARVGRDGNQWPGRPIQLDLVQPPQFGHPGAEGLLERPLVSLEDVSVQTDQSYGDIFFRKVDVSFVVHRPSVVFSGDDRSSTWRSLLQEGNFFTLEYGWTGAGKNPLFNGDGISDNGLVIPGIRRMVVTPTTYRFKLQANGEMRFQLQMFENSEVAMRNARVGQAGLPPPPTDPGRVPPRRVASRVGDRDARAEAQRAFDKIASIGLVSGRDRLLRFGDIADAMFAPAIRRTVLEHGYQGVELYMGNFATGVGRTSEAFGARDLGGSSIADFPVPARRAQEALGALIDSSAGAFEVLPTFGQFKEIINDPTNWDTSGRQSSRPASIAFRTDTRRVPGGGNVFVLSVFDRFDEALPFDVADRVSRRGRTPEQVLTEVRNRGVPVVRVGHGFSYIQDVDFDVVLDEYMRSAFIERAFRDRKSVVEENAGVVRDLAGASEPEQYVVMSAIKGEITTVGNHVFTMFGNFWLNVGVPQVDGLFNVYRKVDKISQGQFTTTLSVMADGSDPMGTQRRR